MDVAAMEKSIGLVRASRQHLIERYEEGKAGKEYSPVDFQCVFDAYSDDVVFCVPSTIEPENDDYSKAPWNVVGKPHVGKQAVIHAYSADQSDLTEWEIGAPLEFFSNADGSRVIVLLKERYSKQGQAVPWNHAALVFDIRDGKITSYTHLTDLSGYFLATGYLCVAGPENSQ